MNELQEVIDLIQKTFNLDFFTKLKIMVEQAVIDLENKYCLCGHNMCHHLNGEGGSPSPCQIEDCMCNDYRFSLLKSLFADRDEFLQSHNNAMDYPHINLMVAIQYVGFNSDLLEVLNEFYTWNGDPATKPKKEDVK